MPLYPKRCTKLFVSLADGCFDLVSGEKLNLKSMSTPYNPDLIPFPNRRTPEYEAKLSSCEANGKIYDATLTDSRFPQPGPKLVQVNEVYQFKTKHEQCKKIGYSVTFYNT